MGESIKLLKKKKRELKAETSHFMLMKIFCGHLTAVITVER